MAFDKINANSGDGLGTAFAMDTFTDTDTVSKVMPFTALAFGAIDGPYTPTTTTDRFPVALSVLPDTSGGDLAAINAALAGTLTVGTHAVTLATLPDTAAGDLAAIRAKDFATQTTLAAVNAKLVSGTTIGVVEIAAGQTVAVTNAGTFAVQVDGAALTALQLIDDAIYTDGTGTPSKGVLVMGTDGTNPQAVSVDTSGHIQADVLSVAGTVTVDGSGVTQPVSGTFWQATQPVSLASVPSHDVTNAGTFAVQSAQSGTWTVDLGATDNAVLDTIASPVATISATPLQRVAIFDSSDTQVTSFVGTQYAEGATAATITGTAAMMEGAANALVPLQGTAADGLLVNLGTNNDVTMATLPDTVAGDLAAMSADTATLAGVDYATSAKQPALGTAGTASADVITVQGIASMTALVVDGSAVTQPVSGTVTANLGATDNAVLDSIAAAVNGTLTVDASGTAVPVTDNGGSLTVDGTVATELANLHEEDYDTGVGTDTTPAIGLAVPASGGAVVVTGDTANGLDVDVTRVSGTVTVDGSGVTQPVSAVSLPLPSGASTAAKQPALGTAGTAASDVITVQGIASMTALVVDGSAVTQPVSVSTLPLPSGAATSAIQSSSEAILTTIDADTGNIATSTTDLPNVIGTDGAAGPSKAVSVSGTESGGTLREFRVDSDGHLQVDILSGTLGTVTTVSTVSAVTTVSTVTNLAQIGGAAVSMGTGTRDAGTQRVTIATDDALTVNHSVGSIGHGVKTVTTAGTDVVLGSTTTIKWVVVQSQTDNTGLISVGGSGVDATEATGTGIILYPGESVTLHVDNLDDIYIDSTVNGEGVRYTYGA